jgi:hypothetical protein
MVCTINRASDACRNRADAAALLVLVGAGAGVVRTARPLTSDRHYFRIEPCIRTQKHLRCKYKYKHKI